MLHKPAELVDRLAEIRSEVKALETEEAEIRAAILALEQNIVEGERYTAILKAVPSTRIDTKAVKAEMGSEWYSAHSVTSTTIRIETLMKAA